MIRNDTQRNILLMILLILCVSQAADTVKEGLIGVQR